MDRVEPRILMTSFMSYTRWILSFTWLYVARCVDGNSCFFSIMCLFSLFKLAVDLFLFFPFNLLLQKIEYFRRTDSFSHFYHTTASGPLRCLRWMQLNIDQLFIVKSRFILFLNFFIDYIMHKVSSRRDVIIARMLSERVFFVMFCFVLKRIVPLRVSWSPAQKTRTTRNIFTFVSWRTVTVRMTRKKS